MATPDPINAVQRQAYEARLKEQLSKVVEAMQLRKWAIEQAIGLITSPDAGTGPILVHELAGEIYDFVAKPAVEFRVDELPSDYIGRK